jgi:hypothetical protein
MQKQTEAPAGPAGQLALLFVMPSRPCAAATSKSGCGSITKPGHRLSGRAMDAILRGGIKPKCDSPMIQHVMPGEL